MKETEQFIKEHKAMLSQKGLNPNLYEFEVRDLVGRGINGPEVVGKVVVKIKPSGEEVHVQFPFDGRGPNKQP